MPADEIVCGACGLPLPPPADLPQHKPWYIRALVVAGVLWVGVVLWYTLNVELPEAHRMQRQEDDRARFGRIVPYTPTSPPGTR